VLTSICPGSKASGFPLLAQPRYELGYAFVVKQDGNTAWRDEHGNTLTHDQGPGMIDLELMTTDKLNGEWVKRNALFQPFKGLFEILCSHAMSLLTTSRVALRKGILPASLTFLTLN
jgi:hypothetical protein